MAFFIFIFAVFVAGYYHRYEHQQLIIELRALQLRLASEHPNIDIVRQALEKVDWSVVELRATRLKLRRKFEINDRDAKLRYAVPVGVICVLLVFLQSFGLAAIYAAILAVKWFVTVTVIDLDPLHAEYEVDLLGRRLFGESLVLKPLRKSAEA
jgi:hypothetical protein